MTNYCLSTAVLIFSALPAFAQTPAKILTPPDVLSHAKTIQFTAVQSLGGFAQEVSSAALVQPNKGYVIDKDFKTKAIDVIYMCDGKMQTEYRASRNRYTHTAAPSQISAIESQTVALSTLTDLLDPKTFAKFKHDSNDAPGIYKMPLGEQDGKSITEELAVDTATGLPRSVSILIAPSLRPAEQVDFGDWILDAPINDGKFAYTPPAGAALYIAPQLLSNGKTAPDFTVQDRAGKPVKLSDYRGKTVVLDFWATWCGPCQVSLPHTTAVAKKYAGKNLVVLAVNVWDTPAAFQAWLPKHPEYGALKFAIDPTADQAKSIATALYGVSGIPTQYVIDANGKITKSIVGYEPGDTQLEDALKSLGG